MHLRTYEHMCARTHECAHMYLYACMRACVCARKVCVWARSVCVRAICVCVRDTCMRVSACIFVISPEMRDQHLCSSRDKFNTTTLLILIPLALATSQARLYSSSWRSDGSSSRTDQFALLSDNLSSTSATSRVAVTALTGCGGCGDTAIPAPELPASVLLSLDGFVMDST